MSEALFIFTFSPIQRFITEARRTSDLRVGSQILVELSRAACEAAVAAGGTLIFPAGSLTCATLDLPNKIMVKTSWETLDSFAKAVEDGFWKEWGKVAASARVELDRYNLPPDLVWEKIWKRQTGSFWEVYWSASRITADGYAAAYDRAERALAARKRSRGFGPSQEEHIKDTLSGRRQALETFALDARKYWTSLSQHPHCSPSRLRRDSPERLDAIGAIKRFSRVANDRNRLFASTSTVASQDFLEDVLSKPEAIAALRAYRNYVQRLLGQSLFETRPGQLEWPYDGVLFYLESLTPRYLKEEFGVTGIDPTLLRESQGLLRKLYAAIGRRPSPYYAILIMDGDDMGRHVNDCMAKPNPEDAHYKLSESLSEYSRAAQAALPAFCGTMVYNGGDDVLALLPLSQAFGAYLGLTAQFQQITGGSASAGIAIVHRSYPLGAALRAARQAEQRAKKVPQKDAVCLCVMKRSGETNWISSPRLAIGALFEQTVQHFRDNAVSSKFAYDVLQSTYGLPAADEKFHSELKRLVNRHRDTTLFDSPAAEAWAGELAQWATRLSGTSEELGRWLVFARFVAAGGEE